MDSHTPATPESIAPVYDAEGHGVAVIEVRPTQVHRFAVYVVADDRMERPRRRRYVGGHRAVPAQLVDDMSEAERWAHRRTAVLVG